MSKIPKYTRDAINRYNAKFDRITINLPRGTKDRIMIRSESVNSYIVQAVLECLEADENDGTRRQNAPEAQEAAKTDIDEEFHTKKEKPLKTENNKPRRTAGKKKVPVFPPDQLYVSDMDDMPID